MSDSNTAKTSPSSYKLAALDQEFLLSDEMRGVRFNLEYSKAEILLRRHKIASTIVVFGSARSSPEPDGPMYEWYVEAQKFGALASQNGGALRRGEQHLNVISTGGGPGIMEAANRGAADVGAPTIGYNITLPHEQEPNKYITPELTFQFHYFAIRKMHLAMRANGLVIFPGGFGTLDEMFEILTLRQTKKMPMIPTVLVGKDYWSQVINFQAMADAGTISPQDPEQFLWADTAEEAWAALVSQGLEMG